MGIPCSPVADPEGCCWPSPWQGGGIRCDTPELPWLLLLGQAPSLPCQPRCAGLLSPCSRVGAVNTFFCSALPCPIRDEAAYLRNCLAK